MRNFCRYVMQAPMQMPALAQSARFPNQFIIVFQDANGRVEIDNVPRAGLVAMGHQIWNGMTDIEKQQWTGTAERKFPKFKGRSFTEFLAEKAEAKESEPKVNKKKKN